MTAPGSPFGIAVAVVRWIAFQRMSCNVERRNGFAPQAAAHPHTATAAVGQAPATLGPGVCARTAPVHCAESVPRGDPGGARGAYFTRGRRGGRKPQRAGLFRLGLLGRWRR